jgi:hypothetical protein
MKSIRINPDLIPHSTMAEFPLYPIYTTIPGTDITGFQSVLKTCGSLLKFTCY